MHDIRRVTYDVVEDGRVLKQCHRCKRETPERFIYVETFEGPLCQRCYDEERVDIAKAVPELGFTAEEWAHLLSQKLSHEQPKTTEAAKAIYVEVISAVMRAERDRANATNRLTN